MGEEFFKTVTANFPDAIDYSYENCYYANENDVREQIRREMVADMARKLEQTIYGDGLEYHREPLIPKSCDEVDEADLASDIELLEMLLARITEERDELAATVTVLQEHIAELNQLT